MANEAELEAKFWKALKSDRTVMLSLVNSEHGRAQPMTALVENDERGPIWIFTSKETDLARTLGERSEAALHFASKGHEVWACVEGELVVDNDPAAIERLWNPWVAAWYENGKTDPKLLLLRFDPEEAQIWLNESSVFAGIKVLLGRDPKKDYDGKVAEVRLN